MEAHRETANAQKGAKDTMTKNGGCLVCVIKLSWSLLYLTLHSVGCLGEPYSRGEQPMQRLSNIGILRQFQTWYASHPKKVPVFSGTVICNVSWLQVLCLAMHPFSAPFFLCLFLLVIVCWCSVLLSGPQGVLRPKPSRSGAQPPIFFPSHCFIEI